jgi:membrane-bound lytic murein transglycosylase B
MLETAAAALPLFTHVVAAAAAGSAAAGNSVALAQDSKLSAMQMNEGFNDFVATLPPTEEENKVKRSTLDAVCRACEQIRLESPNTGMRWQVASVIKTGSYEKATGLRGK